MCRKKGVAAVLQWWAPMVTVTTASVRNPKKWKATFTSRSFWLRNSDGTSSRKVTWMKMPVASDWSKAEANKPPVPGVCWTNSPAIMPTGTERQKIRMNLITLVTLTFWRVNMMPTERLTSASWNKMAKKRRMTCILSFCKPSATPSKTLWMLIEMKRPAKCSMHGCCCCFWNRASNCWPW